MAIKLGDIVYRADIQQNEFDLNLSEPYVQALTIAKITTVERDDGSVEVSLSSQERGRDSGPVWYVLDTHRAIEYGYTIEVTKQLAELSAKNLYMGLTGIEFAGVVQDR